MLGLTVVHRSRHLSVIEHPLAVRQPHITVISKPSLLCFQEAMEGSLISGLKNTWKWIATNDSVQFLNILDLISIWFW